MKVPSLDLAVGALVAVLAALAAVAAYTLVLLGSWGFALAAGGAGLAAVLAVAAAWRALHDAASQCPPLTAEEAPARPPVARSGFKVREARPGEVPVAYLAAVMKGAQATHAALKARSRQH